MSKPAKAFSRFRRSSLEHSLPPYGYLYFDHLNAEFQSNPSQKIDQEIKDVVEELRKILIGRICNSSKYFNKGRGRAFIGDVTAGDVYRRNGGTGEYAAALPERLTRRRSDR